MFIANMARRFRFGETEKVFLDMFCGEVGIA